MKLSRHNLILSPGLFVFFQFWQQCTSVTTNCWPCRKGATCLVCLVLFKPWPSRGDVNISQEHLLHIDQLLPSILYKVQAGHSVSECLFVSGAILSCILNPTPKAFLYMAFETDWFEWEYPPVTSRTQTQLRTRRDPRLFSSPAPKSSHGGLQDRPAGLRRSHTIGRN